MNTFDKPYLVTPEIIEGLRSCINEGTELAKTALGHDYSDQLHELLESLKNASDEEKEVFYQECGLTYNDYLLGVYFLIFGSNYLFPLVKAISFLVTCDPCKIASINNIEIPIIELPDWEKIFILLCKIPIHIINYYITQLDCDNERKMTLLRAIKENDSVSFCGVVSQMGKESYLLVRVAYFYTTEAAIHICQGEENLQEVEVSNFLLSSCDKLGINGEQMKRMGFEGWTLIKNPDYISGSMNSYDERKGAYIAYMNMYLIFQIIYRENRHRYPKEIQEIVDPYIVEPEKIDFYNELLKRGYSFDASGEESTFDDLVIFGSKSGSDKSEYFNGIAHQIVEEGDDTFKEFVKYLADSGYIENTSEAKQLFTFRLTGKCRPTTKDLPKILWNGRSDDSPNELLYIIKHGTDDSKSKYKRAKDFFEGPVFPTKNTSRSAEDAREEFRNKLKRFYPNVF